MIIFDGRLARFGGLQRRVPQSLGLQGTFDLLLKLDERLSLALSDKFRGLLQEVAINAQELEGLNVVRLWRSVFDGVDVQP